MNKMLYQSQLDMKGQRDRQRFLAATQADLKKIATPILVQQSLTEFVEDYFDGIPFAFITIHLTQQMLREPIEFKRAITKGRVLPADFIPIGQACYDEMRSGISTKDATEALLHKFFIRLNQVVLKNDYRSRGRCLTVMAFHENETKLYNADPVNHIHMLCELPQPTDNPVYNRRKFYSQFRRLFNALVIPLPEMTKNCAVLNLKAGKDGHKKYVVKQLIDWNAASDRLFYPSEPRHAARGGSYAN